MFGFECWCLMTNVADGSECCLGLKIFRSFMLVFEILCCLVVNVVLW